MKKIAFIVSSILLLSLPAEAQGLLKKSRKTREKENEELLKRIEVLEAEVAAYKADAIDREYIEEELSGETRPVPGPRACWAQRAREQPRRREIARIRFIRKVIICEPPL